jgi:hypothetical protein
LPGDLKNLFLIGRRPYDENQLTEMLAYVLQGAPELVSALLDAADCRADAADWDVETQRTTDDGRRPDLWLTADDALVVLEIKLGATYSDSQPLDYFRHLEKQPQGTRALVLLTATKDVPPAEVVNAAAANPQVQLCHLRWQDLYTSFSESGRLGQDFAAVLAKEGLMKPPALGSDDYAAWKRGMEAAQHLRLLLEEASDELAALLPGAIRRSTPSIRERHVQRQFDFERAQFIVGFLISRSPRDPQGAPVVYVPVSNRTLEDAERGERAKAANRALRAIRPSWETSLNFEAWPTAIAPIEEVLAGDDFADQVRSLVAFVREVIDAYRHAGYLTEVAATL